MKFISLIIFSINLPNIIQSQITNELEKISVQDSVMLHNFWDDFTTALKEKGSKKLGKIIDFPFYCSPCLADTTISNSNHITVKVNKDLYYKKVSSFLLNTIVKDSLFLKEKFKTYFFHPFFSDKNIKLGYALMYTIKAPSQKSEGLQGLINVQKKNGRYQITGIDTVP